MRREEVGKKVKVRDASKLRVGIVVAQFNEDITGAMLDGAQATLERWGVKKKNISVAHVYGSFEIPFACGRLAAKKKLDALVAIGCIVKGQTRHDEYLANAVTNGLMRISLDLSIPVGLAVLTTNTLAQAKERSRGEHNHGSQAATAALVAALSV
ncbi:6,7-dimethyl-8-ribityllumazine synthase [Candidatus Kaiserbacteria bacterium]|nr:6,7-dimethyl-8-ribityllumazine synthase [Candidatus Kaiserbacteria bacterium]